jgi:hypothetical protein
MEQQLWIGLADVVPTAANTDEAFEEAAGAFVQAFALAGSADEFTERLRGALDGLELELLELESAETVDERLRREGLSDALVALAIEAARAGEVEFSTFHLYPWEDEEERPDPGASLDRAMADASLVRVACESDRASEHEGFVVGIGEGWLLLHWLDPSIVLNGYTALPLDDVEEVTLLTAAESVAVTALERRGVRPVPQPEIALADVPSLLASVEGRFPLVTVHRDRADPGVCVIGRVAHLGEESFILRQVSPAGRWNDSGGYRYDDVTRIDFGGGYEDALALVAGEPDATR